MTELEAFETIARKVHSDGQALIMDGIPCPHSVSVLFYIENFLNDLGLCSPVVSALTHDLEIHNRECIEFNGGYGYDD